MHRMKLVATAAVVALTVLSASPAQAQLTEDYPFVGIWNLNLEASSFDPGSGPQSATRRFGVDEDGFLVSVRTTISPDGNPTFAMARVKLDGRDYPVWTDGAVYAFMADGSLPEGTAAFESIDDRTFRLTQKNAEGEVNPLSPNTWQVSSDGSTLTVTTMGTNGAGNQVHNVEVFDRVEN